MKAQSRFDLVESEVIFQVNRISLLRYEMENGEGCEMEGAGIAPNRPRPIDLYVGGPIDGLRDAGQRCDAGENAVVANEDCAGSGDLDADEKVELGDANSSGS